MTGRPMQYLQKTFLLKSENGSHKDYCRGLPLLNYKSCGALTDINPLAAF
jgi:hypothetical protein